MGVLISKIPSKAAYQKLHSRQLLNMRDVNPAELYHAFPCNEALWTLAPGLDSRLDFNRRIHFHCRLVGAHYKLFAHWVHRFRHDQGAP